MASKKRLPVAVAVMAAAGSVNFPALKFRRSVGEDHFRRWL
jgi:hypothetical protein